MEVPVAEPRSVATLAELDALDTDELLEGYWDGRAGEPEPGHNRSLAYWHGWRNGAVDFGHRQGDAEQRQLVRLVIERGHFSNGLTISVGPRASNHRPQGAVE